MFSLLLVLAWWGIGIASVLAAMRYKEEDPITYRDIAFALLAGLMGPVWIAILILGIVIIGGFETIGWLLNRPALDQPAFAKKAEKQE